MKQAAVAYAERGHRVFPVSKRKHPLLPRPGPGDPELPLADWQDPTKGGFHQGICDPGLVRVWWGVLHRGAGIGLAIPPDVVVIDIDGDDQLARLKREHPTLWALLSRARTFSVNSPGGRHYYFRLREDQAPVSQSHSNAMLDDGSGDVRFSVDVKAGGAGFAVLPPSVTEQGVYSTRAGSLDDLAEMPDFWHEALGARGRSSASGPRRASGRASLRPSTFRPDLEDDPRGPAGRKLPAGTGRHPILFPRACKLREQGLPRDAALSMLRAWNELWFADPKSDDLVVALVDDVYERYSAPEPKPEPEPEPEPRVLSEKLEVPVLRAGKPKAPLSLAATEAGLTEIGVELVRDSSDGGKIKFRRMRSDGRWGEYAKLGAVDQKIIMGELGDAVDMEVTSQAGTTQVVRYAYQKQNQEFGDLCRIAHKRWVDLTDGSGIEGRVREWVFNARFPKQGVTPEDVLVLACGIGRKDAYRDKNAQGEASDGLWGAGCDQIRIRKGKRDIWRWVDPGHPDHRGELRSRRRRGDSK